MSKKIFTQLKRNIKEYKYYIQKFLIYKIYLRYKNVKKKNNKIENHIFNILLLLVIVHIYCIICKIGVIADEYCHIPYFLINTTLIFFLLILSDIIVLLSIPFIKNFILKLNFHEIVLNRDNIFNNDYKKEKNDKENVITFIYPPHKRTNLIPFKSLLWMIELYSNKNHKYKAFYYTLSITIIDTIFLLLILPIYIQNSNNKYLLFFLITAWMINLVIKLKELTGLTFFEKYFSTKITDTDTRYILKNLDIKKYEDGKFKDYTIENILHKIEDISISSRQNIYYFITFVTTVLYIGILTFIGWK